MKFFGEKSRRSLLETQTLLRLEILLIYPLAAGTGYAVIKSGTSNTNTNTNTNTTPHPHHPPFKTSSYLLTIN